MAYCALIGTVMLESVLGSIELPLADYFFGAILYLHLYSLYQAVLFRPKAHFLVVFYLWFPVSILFGWLTYPKFTRKKLG